MKNKDKIPKVMFLCAVARPCFVPATNQLFDGKLGIWPFANLVPAQQSSVHRPAGTPEWKCFNVTREVYEAFILEKVVPAIKAKMRHRRNAPIYIQQDNASTHISNAAFQASMTQNNLHLDNGGHHWQMSLINQPPQSCNFNVLDLCFFNSLQVMQLNDPKNTVVEMVESVKQKFGAYDKDKLNRCFLTLQQVYNAALMVHGSNSYCLPHMGKERLERINQLPVTIEVAPEAANWDEDEN
jgi:hypothetical protein